MCGMTTKDDIIVVKDIVRGYMENRRSIILYDIASGTWFMG